MSGDITQAHLWTDADVWISTDLTAADPINAETGFQDDPDWELVGLLDGDDGFAYDRSEDETNFYAWGGVLVRTARKNFTMTVSFTALEYNDVTRSLIYPGSESGVIRVPRPANIRMAFETREGLVVHRLITSNYAQVVPSGTITENEADLTKYPLTATIFPDATETPALLFVEQSFDGTS